MRPTGYDQELFPKSFFQQLQKTPACFKYIKRRLILYFLQINSHKILN